jgi:hypothetical protein
LRRAESSRSILQSVLPILTDPEHARPALPARTILSHCPGSLVALPLTFSATIAGNASPAQQQNSCATQLTFSCSALLLLAYAFIRYRYSRPLCGSCLVTSYNPPGAVQRARRSGLNCTNCQTWNLCIWITAFSASMPPPPTACERNRTGIPEGRTPQRGRPGSQDRDGGGPPSGTWSRSLDSPPTANGPSGELPSWRCAAIRW